VDHLTIQAVQIPVASFYNIGDRKTIIIHTKLRHRCGGLNADLYRVHFKDDPQSTSFCTDLKNNVLNSSLISLHPKTIYSIEMGTMLLK
jgi:aromatic ring-cleaving dioxygenase